MSNKNLAIGITAGIAVTSVFIAIYFYRENRKTINKIFQLEEDRLNLILDALKNNQDLSSEVKRQLEKLIREFNEVDLDIANELTKALLLFQIGHTEKAIEDLVKIISYLLEQHYNFDLNFIQWLKTEKRNRKRIELHDLLTYCHIVDKKINEIEFQFFIAIKTIRNKEAHKVNFKIDDYLNISGIITAIGAIIKFAKFVYPASPRSENQNIPLPLLLDNNSTLHDYKR